MSHRKTEILREWIPGITLSDIQTLDILAKIRCDVMYKQRERGGDKTATLKLWEVVDYGAWKA